MTTIEEFRKRENQRYQQAADAATDVLVDALCERYRELTGRHANDRMRDDFWQVVRHQ